MSTFYFQYYTHYIMHSVFIILRVDHDNKKIITLLFQNNILNRHSHWLYIQVVVYYILLYRY